MIIKILIILVVILIFYHIFDMLIKMSKPNITSEPFVSGQCPTQLIKKGTQLLLYNPDLAKVPGVNPIVLKDLKEYEEYVKWQRASGLNCPILHLERIYDGQGNEKYEIKNSFMLDAPPGPLNHDLPKKYKTPNVSKLLNADKENNPPFNKNTFPGYDEYNQNIGKNIAEFL
jgi:hypothetical protein